MGCAMELMGESQEEDRRGIAEVTLKTLEAECKPPSPETQMENINKQPEKEKQVSRPGSSLGSAGSETSGSRPTSGKPETGTLRKPDPQAKTAKTKSELAKNVPPKPAPAKAAPPKVPARPPLPP